MHHASLIATSLPLDDVELIDLSLLLLLLQVIKIESESMRVHLILLKLLNSKKRDSLE